jgi:hypothetical protein
MLAGCGTSNTIPPFNLLSRRDAKPPVTVPASQARFAIDPISAVPAEQVHKLTDAIAGEAKARGITIATDADASAPYRLKGYLSAVGGPSGSIMVYVWDILDANGTRLQRISGQEPSNGGAPDPWSGVTDATIRLVAQRTADAVAAWVRRDSRS